MTSEELREELNKQRERECYEEAVELKSDYVVLEIPQCSVEVTIMAKVYMDGEIQTVERTLGMQEIRDAVKEADTIYIPPDATFVLTDVGKKYLEDHREEMEMLWRE